MIEPPPIAEEEPADLNSEPRDLADHRFGSSHREKGRGFASSYLPEPDDLVPSSQNYMKETQNTKYDMATSSAPLKRSNHNPFSTTRKLLRARASELQTVRPASGGGGGASLQHVPTRGGNNTDAETDWDDESVAGNNNHSRQIPVRQRMVPKLQLSSAGIKGGSDTGAGVMVPVDQKAAQRTTTQKLSAATLLRAAESGAAIPWTTLQRMGMLPEQLQKQI